MKRTMLALIAPPAAVARYGCVSCTAAPIGVFWLGSLACIGYGLAGGTLGSLLGPNFLIAAGVLLWLIATAWARLVIRGVESDLFHRAGQHAGSPRNAASRRGPVSPTSSNS